MAKHALLSASSAHRWLACPPSAKLCAEVPDTTSEYAQQGTDAHELCEYKLREMLGEKVKSPATKLKYYDAEMESCTDGYRDFVSEALSTAKLACADPHVFIEQRVNFSDWVPDGFGTCDCLIAADDVLYIIDFKYGLGVMVEAENNPQLMCYALGALAAFDGIYDFNYVSLSIFQPRREHTSTWMIAVEDLQKWAREVLAPTARMSFEGKGPFTAGEHCRFCKIKATCRKRAEYNLEMAAYDFVMPATLKDLEISAILPRIDDLISWSEDIKAYALQQSLAGAHFEGFKLVEGRSTRKYTDEAKVAEAVKSAGLEPFEHKLKGITAMTSLLGKKKFEELLGEYVKKAPGKPTLVPESDKRPAMKNKAIDDFKEEN